MKYLLPLVIASSAFAQQFNGTIYDINTGRIQAINGQIEKPYEPYQPQIDGYKKIIAETKANISRMRAETDAMMQLRELREQTALLRKIANQ